SGRQQLIEGVDVELSSFALAVRAIGAAAVWTFRPFEPKPSQVFEHAGDELPATTLLVEIVVAQ
ncbi:MAG: hypothetical protein ACI9VS_002670, partial [Candidatus Binatia bacterium]